MQPTIAQKVIFSYITTVITHICNSSQLHVGKLTNSSTLFIEDQSTVLLDTWVLSHPKEHDMWFNKLGNASNDENRLENLKRVEAGYSDEECLFMSKISKAEPKYSLSVENCKKKHSAICRIDPQETNVLKEPSMFPCLAEKPGGRVKRSTTGERYQKEQDTKG